MSARVPRIPTKTMTKSDDRGVLSMGAVAAVDVTLTVHARGCES
jgi:hypothetical protein